MIWLLTFDYFLLLFIESDFYATNILPCSSFYKFMAFYTVHIFSFFYVGNSVIFFMSRFCIALKDLLGHFI